MKVLKVVMENYGAFYGRHEFPIANRGLVLVLGENRDEPRMNSNGSAKSTLLESLDWCLYGVIPKGDHADSVINDEANSCVVTAYLEDDDGTPAEIRRERPAALSFTVAGQGMNRDDRDQELDTREIQSRINQWLGMDRDIFHAAVFFGQQDLRHFADSTDGQRMEILSKIIPELGQVDQYLPVAKDYRSKIETLLKEAKHKVAEQDGEIRALEAMDYQAQIDGWESQRQDEVRRYEALVADLQAQYKALGDWDGTITVLEQQIAEMSSKVLPPPPSTVPGMEKAQTSLAGFNNSLVTTRAELQRMDQDLSLIRQTGEGRCGNCGTVVSAEHLAQEIARLTAQKKDGEMRERIVLEAFEKANVVVQQKIVELDKAVAETVRVSREHDQQLGTLRVDLQQAQAKKNEASGLAQRIVDGHAAIKMKKAEVNPFGVQAQQMQARLEELKSTWRSSQSIVIQREKELAQIQFWVDGFSAKGLKSYILDSKCQEMTDAANEWVRLLTGGTFWVRFESQKMGRSSKTLRNAPSIRVFKYQPDGRVTERSYRGWSGGERQRVSWCIDFGLSRLVARRATKRWDLLALDEVFKYVDSSGGEAVVEMLTNLQREKSSIFVIEHDGEFQSHFETVITARKERGRSCIVEDRNVESKGQEAVQQRRIGEGVSKKGKRPKRQAAKLKGAVVSKAQPQTTKKRKRVSRCAVV
jgi:DNA repair exonuclease SbcCD ATPase subunit